MPNFFDYIHWRGDLTFRQSHFNIIDSLIFSRLSYLPFDQLITKTPTPLHKVATTFFNINRHLEPTVIMKEDVLLLKKLMVASRYKNLKVSHFSHIFDIDSELQFSAMMIHLDYRTVYVAFRGTDMSIVGWKEDFNMSFNTTVPAQQCSVDYIKQYEHILPERVYFGGHSKGGNLAMYSALFSPQSVQNKIVEVHNFDGPGFNKKLVISDKLHSLKDKIKIYVPEASVIGILLNQYVDKLVIKSSASSLMQHDTYSWLINCCDFEYTSQTNTTSQQLEIALKNLVNNTSQEELKQVINAIFSIISSADVKDMRDFSNQTSTKIFTMIKSYSNISKEDNTVISSLAQEIIKLLLPTPIKFLGNTK